MIRPRPNEQPISFRQLVGEGHAQKEMLLFVLVSAMDVLMTTYLLWQNAEGSPVFIESNPVARFFVDGWGLKGMIYFKFAMVGFVCVISQIIAQHKPRVARWLLLWATAVAAIVVVYSLMLFVRHSAPGMVDLSLLS